MEYWLFRKRDAAKPASFDQICVFLKDIPGVTILSSVDGDIDRFLIEVGNQFALRTLKKAIPSGWDVEANKKRPSSETSG